MHPVTQIFVLLVAVENIYILWLEMFMWTKPLGRKIFSALSSDMFEKTKALAANHGLYNGFLAAGLIWSLLAQDTVWSKNIAIFFVSCVAIAVIYGSHTAMKKIFYVQALPALITLGLILFF